MKIHVIWSFPLNALPRIIAQKICYLAALFWRHAISCGADMFTFAIVARAAATATSLSFRICQLLSGANSRGWGLHGRRAANHVHGRSSGEAIMHCNGRHRSEVRRFVCGSLPSIDSLCYDVNNRRRTNVDMPSWIVQFDNCFSSLEVSFKPVRFLVNSTRELIDIHGSQWCLCPAVPVSTNSLFVFLHL